MAGRHGQGNQPATITGSERNARQEDRPPLIGITVVISESEQIGSFGPRSVRKLDRGGHAIAVVRTSTVLFRPYSTGAGALDTPRKSL